ncbi:hypothetical protein AOLI_G00135440 [Acnodon oligacanthus]
MEYLHLDVFRRFFYVVITFAELGMQKKPGGDAGSPMVTETRIKEENKKDMKANPRREHMAWELRGSLLESERRGEDKGKNTRACAILAVKKLQVQIWHRALLSGRRMGKSWNNIQEPSTQVGTHRHVGAEEGDDSNGQDLSGSTLMRVCKPGLSKTPGPC